MRIDEVTVPIVAKVPKKKCGKKKAAGWGAMHVCVFNEGHDKGENPTPHSWVVT